MPSMLRRPQIHRLSYSPNLTDTLRVSVVSPHHQHHHELTQVLLHVADGLVQRVERPISARQGREHAAPELQAARADGQGSLEDPGGRPVLPVAEELLADDRDDDEGRLVELHGAQLLEGGLEGGSQGRLERGLDQAREQLPVAGVVAQADAEGDQGLAVAAQALQGHALAVVGLQG